MAAQLPSALRGLIDRTASSSTDAAPHRKVWVGRAQQEERYASNKITTTKYNPITFLPLNLWEQFHRVAYLYFLLITVLNQVPALEAVDRTASLIPLLFVLTASALKDAYTDWRRHVQDRQLNATLVSVWDATARQFVPRPSHKLRVGDRVRLYAEEALPADVLATSSSGDGGVAWVDTCSLDGETNLKPVYAVGAVGAALRKAASAGGGGAAGDAYIECEPPSVSMSAFHGAFYAGSAAPAVPLGSSNLLLRSTVLRNTELLEGVVLYTGPDTKVMLNGRKAPYKRSRLVRRRPCRGALDASARQIDPLCPASAQSDAQTQLQCSTSPHPATHAPAPHAPPGTQQEASMNREVAALGATLLLMCAAGAAGYAAHLRTKSSYFVADSQQDMDPAAAGAIRFFSLLLPFQIMVPLCAVPRRRPCHAPLGPQTRSACVLCVLCVPLIRVLQSTGAWSACHSRAHALTRPRAHAPTRRLLRGTGRSTCRSSSCGWSRRT